MPRQRTGTLEYRQGKGFFLRVTIDIEGEDGIPRTQRRWIDLETHDKPRAVRLQRKIVAELAASRVVEVKCPRNLVFEAMRPPPTGGVYFVRAGVDRVKIGTSRNIARRVSDLQTTAPFPLELIAVTEGGRAVEAAYHRKFSASRIVGEWYRLDGQVVGEILKIRGTPAPAETAAAHNDNDEEPWCDSESVGVSP